MIGIAEKQTTRRWGRGGMLALLVALAMGIAALPGLASAGSLNSAHLTSPLGHTLTSPDQTFTWSKGVGVTNYELLVGRTIGGSQIYDSGILPATQQSITATGLPADGSTLRVRILSKIGTTWQYNDYSFAAAQPVIADISSPVQRTILPGTTVTFDWTAVVSQGYMLTAGSTPGGSDECLIGPIGPGTPGFGVNATCFGLPNDTSTVYVRLATNVGTVSQPIWLYHDYAYTAAGAVKPVIAATFTNCPAGGGVFPAVDDFVIAGNPASIIVTAGTTGPGSNNLGTVSVFYPTNLFVNVTCPATAGQTVTEYVRLWYQFGALWYHDDYAFVYTAS